MIYFLWFKLNYLELDIPSVALQKCVAPNQSDVCLLEMQAGVNFIKLIFTASDSGFKKLIVFGPCNVKGKYDIYK